MGTIGELTLEEAASQAAGNWNRYSCFCWDRLREIDDPDDWTIIYTHHRDSGLLDQSNAAPMADALRSFSETENPDVVFEAAVHRPGTPKSEAVPRLGPDTAEDTAGRLHLPGVVCPQLSIWEDEMAAAARFNSGLKDGPFPWHPLNRPYILIVRRSARSSRRERVRTPRRRFTVKSRRYPRVTCLLRIEELETRLTPAPVVLQPDLQITNIGTASDGPPAQMVFGPDGRLYLTLANFSGPNAASVESFAYS